MTRSLISVAILMSTAGALATAWAAASPPPPSAKFWTAAHCEQVLRAHKYALPTVDGHRFQIRERVCVGTGGPHACEWTSDHRSRVFSQYLVLARARSIGGVLRSFSIATRPDHGLVKVVHHYGDQYLGWPADFYLSPASARLVAHTSTPASFKAIVTAAAARLTQREDVTGCVGS